MLADAEPGTSKHMSVEEEAKDANKSFWFLSQELEEVEAATGASSGDCADDKQEGREDDAETSFEGDTSQMYL